MKILQIHNKYIHPGGEDEVVQTEKNLINEFGHEVLSYEESNISLEKLSLIGKAKFAFKDAYFSKDSYNRVSDIIKKNAPDVAHIHNTFYKLSPSVYQACYDNQVPIVQTLHNYRFLCPIGTFYRDNAICEKCLVIGKSAALQHRCFKNSTISSFVLLKTLNQFQENQIHTKMIQHYIAPSEFTRRIHVDNGFEENHVTYKPHCLLRDPGFERDKDDYFLFVGSLQSYKGILTLLKAYQKLGITTPLKVVGTGPLLNQLKPYLSDNVKICGQYSQEDTLKLIKKAKALIIPSECYETFSRVTLEAFACGTPVIASDIGAIKELVEHGKDGILFKPGDVDDCAYIIKRFIELSSKHQEMSYNVREKYEKNYSSQENFKILEGIYNKVINLN